MIIARENTGNQGHHCGSAISLITTCTQTALGKNPILHSVKMPEL